MAAENTKVPPAKLVVDSSIKLFRAYVEAANKLPSKDDYDYHSVFPGFVETMNSHKERLDKIVNVFANAAVSPQRQRKLLSTESRNRVLDVVDMMFENIDTLLDEVNGAKMSADAQNAAFSNTSVVEADEATDEANPEAYRHSKSFASSSSSNNNAGSSAAASTVTTLRKTPIVAVARPQLTFARPVDNSPTPFKPLLFNAETHELAYGTSGVHPFKEAIEGFAYTPDQLRYREELLPNALLSTNLHFVTSVADLEKMIEEHLAPSKEFAIDLEHHEAHSYQGITCLMQISTRTDDFLVDVFPLRDELHRLNKVFLDPKIVKVLHGCREDIRWLQKDFGLYIVNLFDTGIALQTLHMPYSLAFAVDHYCQVKLNKQYQKADWRVRPIPSDMVHYARQDTHYLLYIYDRLSNQLLQQEGGRAAVLGNLLVYVLNESRQMSLLQYEKPAFDEKTSFRDGLGKALLGLTAAQSERARVIYNWREQVARLEDESPLSVMHPSSVVQLATSPAFGKHNIPTATQLLRSIHPLSMAVRSQIKGLVDALSTCYADDEAPSASLLAAAGRSAFDGANVKGGKQQARRQLRHYPLTGTLPSVIVRNENPNGAVFEIDEEEAPAAGTSSSATPAAAASSALIASVLANHREVVAHTASLYRGILPPTSPCLTKKPVAATAALGMEGRVDALGIQRPGAKETLLMKAIREEKAAAGKGGDAAADGDDALPDEITFAAGADENADAGAEVVGEKRAREEDNKEEGEAEEKTDGEQLPLSLKDQYGLGRTQRKKGGIRKE